MKKEPKKNQFKNGIKKLLFSRKSDKQNEYKRENDERKHDSQSINVGVIGAGRMGITHFAIINGLEGVNVTSIADTSTQLLSMFNKYVNVSTYEDWQIMLENEKLDAVLICTPPSLNMPIIEMCAEKDIHVFIEKPFLMNSSDALTAAQLFEQKKLINQVGYVNRYNAVFCRLKQLISDKSLGDVIRFKTEMYSATVVKEESGSGWRGSAKSGGGATYEMATHAIDLSVYLFGAPDNVSGTSFTSVFSKNVDDIVSSSLNYDSGCVGGLYVNWSDKSYRKPSNVIEVIFSKGKIIADQYELKVFCNETISDELREGWNTFSITDLFYNVPFYVRGNEFTMQLHRFVESIRNKESGDDECSFRDAAHTLLVIERMRKDYDIHCNGEIKK